MADERGGIVTPYESLAELGLQRRRFLKAVLSGAAVSVVGGSMLLTRLAHGAGLGLTVKFAVYGALPGGDGNHAQAIDVTQKLQNLINNNGGIVTCNNSNFTDPSPGNLKHFGAKIIRSGRETVFACEENQTIDFNHAGDFNCCASSNPGSSKSLLTVKFAVYGALPGGNRSAAQATDVSALLQANLDQKSPIVVCGNDAFAVDASPGNRKHFAAVVNRFGLDGTRRDFAFACAEGQTINFQNGGS